jgi:hypothetical protein
MVCTSGGLWCCCGEAWPPAATEVDRVLLELELSLRLRTVDELFCTEMR